MFKLKHEIIRYGAAATAVVFAVLFLVSLMPWIFDRLEGRSFRSFVAVRHVRAGKSGFLTVISVLADSPNSAQPIRLPEGFSQLGIWTYR